jgi:signal transduction histidine kinase
VIRRTGRPARMDSYEGARDEIAARVRAMGLRSGVGAPITVGGRRWGAMVASWTHASAAPGSEKRVTQFTDLVATALANAQNRAELAASRARVVTTADETRRQIERDLHDGAQQRLVHAVITLKLALRSLGESDAPGVELVKEALAAYRARDGRAARPRARRPAGRAKPRRDARRHRDARLAAAPAGDPRHHARAVPAYARGTASFIVAEALTNTSKHAHARSAHVSAAVEDGALRVQVHDDGVGGARVHGSSGLLGLQDRASALNGELVVESPPGGGTTITAILPILR